MAAPVCNECFDPVCAKSANAAVACNCVDFLHHIVRNDGGYGNNLYNALPPAAQTVTTGHVDALRNHTPAVAVMAVSAGAVALFNGGANVAGPPVAPWYSVVDGANLPQMGQLVELYKHHPDQRHNIMGHLEVISFNAAQAGQRDSAERAIKFCQNHEAQLSKAAGPVSASADDFENRKHPLARLYHQIVKYTVLGPLTTAQSGLTSGRMDPVTGKPVLSFEKLKDVGSMNLLHLAWRDFESAVYLIGKNGGRKAWAPFWQIIYDLARTNEDATYLNELVFEAMTTIDLDPNKNIGNFVSQHMQTFLITFNAKWENGPAGGNDPPLPPTEDVNDGGLHKSGPKHVKFGPVTKQGQWSGEMRTRNGAIAFCNKWNENKECTHGVFAGRDKGKCAYTHKCRYCMSAGHWAEKKHPAGHAQAGEWVCSKHP